MSDNYSFPGNNTSYVPQLHGDLIVEFSRNPAKFAINRYCNVRKVDKQKGYFVRMRNDAQNRVVNSPQHYVWPDGNDAPVLTDGNDGFEFPQFNCVRYAYTKRLGYLGVEQASWDLMSQASRLLAMQGMTARSYRVAKTLTTSSNYPTANLVAAVADGGATWANATSTLPSIRKTITKAAVVIQQATLGVVMLSDLYVVFNPNTARIVMSSQEMIDYLKQSPDALSIWEGPNEWNSRFGVPPRLFGMNVVVDDTVYNSTNAGVTAVQNYTIPDNVAIVVTKQQAIAPSAGTSFSTFELFAYEEFSTYVQNDVFNRRYDLQVVEDVDDSQLFAPTSGAYISTNA